MKAKKYEYWSVIQQNYGKGFEDVESFETNSKFIPIDRIGFKYLLQEYSLLRYPTRVIQRKVKLGA